MTQARFADQLNGLEQARGHVFEQDPVGGKVDVRLQAGAHLKGLLQSRPTGQIGIARHLVQALMQPGAPAFPKTASNSAPQCFWRSSVSRQSHASGKKSASRSLLPSCRDISRKKSLPAENVALPGTAPVSRSRHAFADPWHWLVPSPPRPFRSPAIPSANQSKIDRCFARSGLLENGVIFTAVDRS